MSSNIIPYGRQWINSADIKAVVKVLKSDFLTQGNETKKFESEIAKFCNTKYAASFSSGTAALHAACFAAGIKENTEVITTPLTFAASANCILYQGGRPVFVDIQKNLPVIDYSKIVNKINSKTKAIIPVDYAGIPVDYREIGVIAKKYNLVVIADASHSIGADYLGRKVGQLAQMSIFSFHAVKTITTGEGGMVVTDIERYYQKLLLFRSHGITKDPQQYQQKVLGAWYHEMQTLGYNYRLTELQSALGRSQLKKIDYFLAKRNEIASLYQEGFKNFPYLKMVVVPKDRNSSWYLFPILLNSKKLLQNKSKIFKSFYNKGIQLQVHFIPIHLHPYYRELFHYKEGDFPNSEEFYYREISIPIYPLLSLNKVRKVIQITKSILESFASIKTL